MKKILIIFLVLVVLAIVLFGFSKQEVEIIAFEDCAAAGYPVGESHPRQCWTPDGRHFIEKITWRNDGVSLARVKETGKYQCFGCNFNSKNSPALCIDPFIDAIEFVEETEERYCNNDFEVVDNGKTEVNNLLELPSNLALPFDIEKMDEGISPFGIIRHNKDNGHGHGGIDIGLESGDSVYAVADAEIIYYELNPDGRGGNDIHLLLSRSKRDGEGWGFLIEHMTLEEELGVGSKVLKGQKIGESAITQGSNHMQLTYLFNNYEFFKDHKCWIELLDDTSKAEFDKQFDSLKEKIADWWNTAYEDNYYPYRALIGSEDPKPCYPFGTDARTKE